MKGLGLVLIVVLLGCGGSSEGDEGESAAPPEPVARSAAEATATSPTEEEASAVDEGDLPLRTITAAAVPDPCALLTTGDAAELLGEPVGPPRQPDAGGYPCVYRAEGSDGQIALDMSLARGAAVEDTQLAITLEYCEGEAVTEVDDLGYRAALFRMRKEDCGVNTFWVSAGVYIQGTEPSPHTGLTPEGYIHFTYTLRPAPDDETLIEKLSIAAERALERLPR